MTWVCRHCDAWFRDWGVLQEHLEDVAVRCRIDRLGPAIASAADDPPWVATARRRRDELRECFGALDVPAAKSCITRTRASTCDMLGPDLPDLTAAEWTAILEAAAADCYVRCYQRDYSQDYEIRWLVRYDSHREEWVYATVTIGETYHGPDGEY